MQPVGVCSSTPVFYPFEGARGTAPDINITVADILGPCRLGLHPRQFSTVYVSRTCSGITRFKLARGKCLRVQFHLHSRLMTSQDTIVW